MFWFLILNQHHLLLFAAFLFIYSFFLCLLFLSCDVGSRPLYNAQTHQRHTYKNKWKFALLLINIVQHYSLWTILSMMTLFKLFNNFQKRNKSHCFSSYDVCVIKTAWSLCLIKGVSLIWSLKTHRFSVWFFGGVCLCPSCLYVVLFRKTSVGYSSLHRCAPVSGYHRSVHSYN